MKKYVLMVAVFGMVLVAGLSSCSKEEIEEWTWEKEISGTYYFLDGNRNGTYRFYKNHLVVYDGGVSVAPGALTTGWSFFLGTWEFDGKNLTTTFTSGSFGGFDWNQMLFGTLTLTDVTATGMTFHDKDYGYHELKDSQKRKFLDYTRDTEVDAALWGTWYSTIYVDRVARDATMIINEDGTAHFTVEGVGVDFDTTYSTKNGCVTFKEYLSPDLGTRSYIFIRENRELEFYSTKNATNAWSWNRIKS